MSIFGLSNYGGYHESPYVDYGHGPSDTDVFDQPAAERQAAFYARLKNERVAEKLERLRQPSDQKTKDYRFEFDVTLYDNMVITIAADPYYDKDMGCMAWALLRCDGHVLAKVGVDKNIFYTYFIEGMIVANAFVDYLTKNHCEHPNDRTYDRDFFKYK